MDKWTLRESEQRFRGFFDSAVIGMAMADLEGRFVHINPAFCETVGYDPKELTGRHFQTLVHPDDLKEEVPMVTRLINGDIASYRLEERLIHKKGWPVWVKLSVSLFRDVKGKPTHLIASIEDMAETRKARQKIERQRAVLEGINRVFREALTCETDEDVARTCLDVAVEMTGSQLGFIGEINPQGLFDTIAMNNPGWEACRMPESNAPRLIRGMKIQGIYGSVLLQGTCRIVNDPASHPDRVGTPAGHPAITSFLGIPLKQGNRVFGMIGLANKPEGYEMADEETVKALSLAFVEALTNKRNEMELRKHRHHLERLVRERTAELERSNSELEQFAYVASHDLQEPLRKVQSFGDRFVAKYGSHVDERGRDYLARMQSAVGRMGTMIQDLLSLSRVTTQGGRFGAVDLMKTVQGVLSDMEATIDALGGLFELGDLPTIEADSAQIRQLMLNLISNAFKYRKPDAAPFVRISAKMVSPGDEPACEIRVEDNGIGFEEAYLERIFQPFQRLHGRSEYEGSGMGLAICRKIADRHGGSITAQSVPGEGATFIVNLPAKQDMEAKND